MKKFMKLVSIAVLTVGVLAACNSDDKEENATPVDNNTPAEDNETPADDTDDEELGNEAEEDETDNEDNSASNEQFADQLDLGLGDTGRFSGTVGAYEITLHSVRKQDEVDGQKMFDYMIIGDATVKNIGNETVDAHSAVDALELVDSLDGGGSSEFSKQLPSIEEVSGELEPGEETTGQIVFAARENNEHFIRVNSGLVAAGAVYNQVIWRFEDSEVE
ncbi:protein of unknown function [Evansella caseinilytica]|uniref:DUF4352 domain-containing protein n=1 Tax=Evansella caseinilytica TaxID=1503961 RepID=A0A1H3QYT5_9BACI|nr:DUF4352 domain-containing protein [Evansella caseinilytica]SDZ18128.1 protein of unknown function [Evansella caseinilytica]